MKSGSAILASRGGTQPTRLLGGSSLSDTRLARRLQPRRYSPYKVGSNLPTYLTALVSAILASPGSSSLSNTHLARRLQPRRYSPYEVGSNLPTYLTALVSVILTSPGGSSFGDTRLMRRRPSLPTCPTAPAHTRLARRDLPDGSSLSDTRFKRRDPTYPPT